MSPIAKFVSAPLIFIAALATIGGVAMLADWIAIIFGSALNWDWAPRFLGYSVAALLVYIVLIYALALLYLVIWKPISWVARAFGRRRADWEGDADDVVIFIITLHVLWSIWGTLSGRD